MEAGVLLVLVLSVVLQLLLVGVLCLLQRDQGSGQQLFLVSVPPLGHCPHLCLGEALQVPQAFVLPLKEQMGQ